MNMKQILDLAEKWQHRSASAAVSLQDAKSCYERGLYQYAVQRALSSLLYSIGIYHDDYQNAKRHAEKMFTENRYN